MLEDLDAVVCSDWHLGSSMCLSNHISGFISEFMIGNIKTKRLILNGDIVNSLNFNRFSEDHERILRLIKLLGETYCNVTWLGGNHEARPSLLETLLGRYIDLSTVVFSGDTKFMCLHGHTFDPFITDHPILTAIADAAYYVLQKVDRTHKFAASVKRNCKTLTKCSDNVFRNAISLARAAEVNHVCCGHTHMAAYGHLDGIHYYNSGSWTEKPCTFLTIKDGKVQYWAFKPKKGGICGPLKFPGGE